MTSHFFFFILVHLSRMLVLPLHLSQNHAFSEIPRLLIHKGIRHFVALLLVYARSRIEYESFDNIKNIDYYQTIQSYQGSCGAGSNNLFHEKKHPYTRSLPSDMNAFFQYKQSMVSKRGYPLCKSPYIKSNKFICLPLSVFFLLSAFSLITTSIGSSFKNSDSSPDVVSINSS